MESESMNLNTIRTDRVYNFVKLFNEALSENDDIGTINGSPFDHGDNECKYYSPEHFAQNIHPTNNSLSLFCLNSTSGIIIADVADHFGTFHIVNKCKQPPIQKYSQIRQLKTATNVLRFNNILANADYSSVLLSDCPNYPYHTFIEINDIQMLLTKLVR